MSRPPIVDDIAAILRLHREAGWSLDCAREEIARRRRVANLRALMLKPRAASVEAGR